MFDDNQPLMVLVTGLTFIVLLVLALNPGVQGAVAKVMNSDSFVSYLQDSQTTTNNSDSDTGFVSRVVDGDTIVLEDGRDIRYLYIDTPETVKPGTPVQCYGPEAKKMNQILVEGKEVVLVKDKELEDRYGRDLRVVFIKGVDTTNMANSVNAQLVKRGFAKVKIYQPNDTYEKEFKGFESEAQKAQKGLWSECQS